MPTLKAGSWNNPRAFFFRGSFSFSPTSGGFTLIEVIVVISLISVMMVFAFPRLSGFLHVDNRDQAARWVIAANVRLKNRAVKEQARCVLRVDMSGNRMSVMSGSGQDGSDQDASGGQGGLVEAGESFVAKEGLEINGVAFSTEEIVSTGTADIVFYEQGYSDRAVIHMTDGDRRFSFYIAPFLSRVRVYDGHVAPNEAGGGA